jgi:TonB family protein
MKHVGEVKPAVARRGKGGEAVRTTTKAQTSESRIFTDPGEMLGSLAARALASQGRVPVFQSDELVIEFLVKPVYPERMRDRGIEGRVSVLALVDTTGSVVDAEIVTASGAAELDEAAFAAARQCRFRPYRVGGEAREVYAVFRYRFTLH